jgi:hypothetical protein
MIAFLIYALVLWLAWRWLCRQSWGVVEIAPPAPTTITINVYVKELHVERRIAPE